MEEINFEIALANICNTKGGLQFIAHLLDYSGCFEQGGATTSEHTRGRKDFGLYISDLLQEHALDRYIEILKLRRNKQ
jgi:hypothetical protein